MKENEIFYDQYFSQMIGWEIKVSNDNYYWSEKETKIHENWTWKS